MILLFWSYTLIPLSQAMAISFTTPLFMYLGAILFFKERVAQKNNAVLILGFILTLVLIRPDLDLKLGALIALLASVMHAIAGLLVKKISRTESVLTLMLSMVCIMTPISLIPSLYVWVHPNNLSVVLFLLLIAIFATIGNYLWTKALSLEQLTNLMPFEFSKLIFATLLGLFFFNEKLDYLVIVGAVGLLILNNFLVKEIKSNEKF
jgi:drug/metabolite transporter (DMT)-like permease